MEVCRVLRLNHHVRLPVEMFVVADSSAKDKELFGDDVTILSSSYHSSPGVVGKI